ncbi:hypothetical protein DR950_00145 [Kitasatospora xanthocidica]|uniref:Pyrrolo-quinoline quinone repeat domain-containing protein n=1 Tax=Kitasatospora xanthocidica TaxID=83382 RepID=A0A372ZKN2_9ACTN|nr:PQQ-binding-like beta-propeller repeat protein [Kitasatospora xanthocidica]RGD56409.1 hypothetical protein DR950_00145 [Kitasatospora xanthocidica]
MAVPAPTTPFAPDATPLWERPLAPHFGYRSTVTTVDGVFVDRRDVIDLATGATLWELPWDPSDRSTLIDPYQNFLLGCGAFGDDLTVLAPRPDKQFKVTGCDPRSGQTRWHTPLTRVDPFVWSDRAGKEPYLAAGGGMDMMISDRWTSIDPCGDRIRWETPLDTPAETPTADAPPHNAGDILIGLADDHFLPCRIAGLDARTGQVRWRLDDPDWALVGVSDTYIVTMHRWDSYGQPLCPGHFIETGDANSYHARRPAACGVCRAYVAVRVLDRATGRVRWEHAWRSAGRSADWSIALAFPDSNCQGAAAVCGDVLVTGEGDHLRGHRLSDGKPLWTASITDLADLDGGRINLTLPHLGTHQHWLPIDIEEPRTTVLVHAATGRTITLDSRVWTVIDHTVLIRDSTRIRALALPSV